MNSGRGFGMNDGRTFRVNHRLNRFNTGGFRGGFGAFGGGFFKGGRR